MKSLTVRRIAILALVLCSAQSLLASPLGTAFTYQGQLKQGGSPANGNFNMEFRLFDSDTVGNPVGPRLSFGGPGGDPTPISVTNGLFTVPLDFGAVYNGDRRWLEITVAGTTLTPRQELTAASYASFSSAPWATSRANIFNVNSGSVGIGTNLPEGGLSVTTFKQNLSPTQPGVHMGRECCAYPNSTAIEIVADVGGAPVIDFNTLPSTEDFGARLSYDAASDSLALSGASLQVSGANVRVDDGEFQSWGPITFHPDVNVTGDAIVRFVGSTGNETMRVDASGNVGVGTISPAANLDVVGNGALPHVRIAARDDASTPYGAFLSLDGTPTTGGKNWLIYSTGASASEGQGKLLFRNYTDGALPLALTPDGNVGVGTASPNQKLSVVGTIESMLGGFKFPDGTTQTTAATAGPSGPWSVNGNTIYYTGNRVGIGTPAPSGALEVVGSSAPGALDQQQHTVDAPFNSTSTIWQSFTPSSNSLLTQILVRNGVGGTWTATLSIYQGQGTGGTLLTSQAVTYSGGLTLAFTLNTPVSVQAGALYTFAFTATGGSTVKCDGAGSGNPYTGGMSSFGSSTDLYFETYVRAASLLVTDSGNVGIGTVSPSQKLQVAGNICATGTIATCSDRRFKKDIKPLTNALSKLGQLNPVEFRWRQSEFPDHQFSDAPQIGFIAQQVREIVPQAVQEGSDGYLAVDYGRLTPVLTQAMHELKAEKDVEIGKLRTENVELRTRLERLECILSASASKGAAR